MSWVSQLHATIGTPARYGLPVAPFMSLPHAEANAWSQLNEFRKFLNLKVRTMSFAF